MASVDRKPYGPKNVVAAVGLSASVALLSMCSSIILQPLVLSKLGDRSFLVWTAVISICGVAAGVLNAISTASAASGSEAQYRQSIVVGVQWSVAATVILSTLSVFLDGEEYQRQALVIVAVCMPLITTKFVIDRKIAVINVVSSVIVPRVYELAQKAGAVAAIAALVYILPAEETLFAIVYFGLGAVAAVAFGSVVQVFPASPERPAQRLESSAELHRAAFAALPFLASQNAALVLISFSQIENTAISTVFLIKLFSLVIITSNVVLPIFVGIASRSRHSPASLKRMTNGYLLGILAGVLLGTVIAISWGGAFLSAWLGRADLSVNTFSVLSVAAYTLIVAWRSVIFYADLAAGVSPSTLARWYGEAGSFLLIALAWKSALGATGVAVVSVLCFVVFHLVRASRMR